MTTTREDDEDNNLDKDNRCVSARVGVREGGRERMNVCLPPLPPACAWQCRVSSLDLETGKNREERRERESNGKCIGGKEVDITDAEEEKEDEEWRKGGALFIVEKNEEEERGVLLWGSGKVHV